MVESGGGGAGGGGGYIPPPIFQVGDGLYYIYHPPNISRLNVIIIPTIYLKYQQKIMKEIVGLECRNAQSFLARSARSHT